MTSYWCVETCKQKIWMYNVAQLVPIIAYCHIHICINLQVWIWYKLRDIWNVSETLPRRALLDSSARHLVINEDVGTGGETHFQRGGVVLVCLTVDPGGIFSRCVIFYNWRILVAHHGNWKTSSNNQPVLILIMSNTNILLQHWVGGNKTKQEIEHWLRPGGQNMLF